LEAIDMNLTFQPSAAQAIDNKGSVLLGEVRRLEFPVEPQKPGFQTERMVAEISDEDIIGEPHAWLHDAAGQRVLAFIERNGVTYGFSRVIFSA
jgi:hypothetical protein